MLYNNPKKEVVMKEVERLQVVSRIKRNIFNMNAIKKTNSKIKKLTKDEKVAEYIKLKEELELLKDRQRMFTKSDKRIIESEFAISFQTQECNHEIWIYTGSYKIAYDSKSKYGYSLICDNEDSEDFKYNKYVCLECGREVIIENWQDFENSNHVLKNRNDIDVHKY